MRIIKDSKAGCWEILFVIAIATIIIMGAINWAAGVAREEKDAFLVEAKKQGFTVTEVTKIPPTLDYSVNSTELLTQAKQLNITTLYVYPDRLGWLVSILKENESWTCKPK